ncbi:MAG: hypothetical protein DI547_03130 [Sphingobium sp.]|nr:MAG: hypothetical protein DI547_03130 [Sphingobium sp.]
MMWTETRTQEEVEAWRAAVRRPNDGALARGAASPTANDNAEHWAEALEEIRRNPPARLSIAVRHLPKPAAFREACRALRQRINELAEAGRPVDDALFALHRLAAISSIAAHEQLQITPFADIEQLDLGPDRLGWRQLPLLGERDYQMMELCWGRPTGHASGAALYPHIAVMAAEKLVAVRRAEAAMPKPAAAETDRRHAHASPLRVLSRVSGWFRRDDSRRAAG